MWGLNSSTSILANSFCWCPDLGSTNRPSLPWPVSVGSLPRCPLPGPGVLFGLRFVMLGHPITHCTVVAVFSLNFYSFWANSLGGSQPWLIPSPCLDCQSPFQPCLGPARLHPVRESMACAVSICCSCCSSPWGAASLLLFVVWFV